MKNKYIRILGLVAAILISVLIFVFRDKFADLKGFGLLGLFVLSIIGNATIIIPVPVVVTAFVGGSIFNPYVAAAVIALGASIGELTGYLAGYSGKALIKDSEKVQKIEKWMKKYGLWAIFGLAAVPNPLFDLAGIVSGATKIPIYKYLPVVWAGKMIKFLVLALLGSKILAN